MKTNKKAGLIVGFILIGLAVLVFWLGTHKGGKDEAAQAAVPSPAPAVTQPAPSKGETKTKNTESSERAAADDSAVSAPAKAKPAAPAPAPVPTPAEPKVVVPDIDQYTNGVKGASVPNENTSVMVLNETDLGKPSQDIKAPMVVIAKNVVLLDQDQGQTTGKQLVYELDLTGGSNLKLSLYVNGTAYNGLEIGDKLDITYKVYKNKEGVQFPIIVSAEKPSK